MTLKTLLFTGGGTAGHVIPNLVLIDRFLAKNVACLYIGSRYGPEYNLVSEKSIPFYSISCGKLRRYFSFHNIFDVFKIFLGILQSIYYLFKLKPDLVFSKGGFVSFPVVVGAWINRIPVILHESDLSPGLANKLALPFARTICTSFEKTARFLPSHKHVVFTGNPIRQVLFDTSPQQGRDFFSSSYGFSPSKPILFILGGGQGAKIINDAVFQALDTLLVSYNIIHACGMGKMPGFSKNGYRPYDYLHDDYAYALAASDAVVLRAGANSVYEVLALKKLHLFIPLSKQASRGDQIENAAHFESQGYSRVLNQDILSAQSLIHSVSELINTSGFKEG